jgi:methyl-accepting chemotaxis protein
MKIKFKMSLIVIIIVVAVVAGIAVVLLSKSSTMALDISRESMKRLALQQASFLQGREEGYLRVARTMAGIMADFENTEIDIRRPLYNQMLESALMAEPNIMGIYAVWMPNVLDGRDSFFAGITGNTNTGQFAPWYTRLTGTIEHLTYNDIGEAMEILNGDSNRVENISDPLPGVVKGKQTYLFNMRVPIIDSETDVVVGLVGIRIYIDALQPIIDAARIASGVAAMTVYSNNGIILAHLFPDRIGKTLVESDVTLFGNHAQRAQTAVEKQEQLLLREYSPQLKGNLEIAIVPVPIGNGGNSWSIMIGVQEAVILAEVRQMQFFSLIVAIAAVIFSALIIYFVVSSITRPIVRVAHTLKDISEGEGDLTKTIVLKNKDEIGDMAKYFNATLEKIRNLVVVIKNQAHALHEIGGELATNMTETAASVNEIASNVQSVKQRVINQSASVTETNSTMEEITRNIEKLNGNIEQQNESVAQSSAAIEQMVANIRSVTDTLVKNSENVNILADASEAGHSGLQAVAGDIREIAEESEGLLEINSVIENIASQTNLLSMNAAIEAAHAGEAGKGFAIVAEEIRKLAESSAEQSKTISGVLKKIKESIDKITKSTEAVLTRFESISEGVETVSLQEETIRNAMEEQNTGSKQILDAINRLNDITRHVKDGSMEMLEGSKEVIQESKNLEHVTQEISGGMNEMATGTDQINVAVNRINEISGDNKRNIDILVHEVAKFKVE